MRKTILTAVVLTALALAAWLAFRRAPEAGISASGPLSPIAAGKNERPPAAPANGEAVTLSPASAKEPPDSVAGQTAATGSGRPAEPGMDPAREALAKLKILEEIIRSKNDNDPRLDRDFKALSPQSKRLFRQKYLRLPAEGRNERGTVVYILGKNLNSAEDWDFLNAVVSEPPCLSLADCSKTLKATGDAHFASGTEITLAYPAIVALKLAEKTLKAGKGTGVAAQQAMRVIISAKSSRSSVVSSMAADMERRLQTPD